MTVFKDERTPLQADGRHVLYHYSRLTTKPRLAILRMQWAVRDGDMERVYWIRAGLADREGKK